jgi:preprotein translocase subunit SecG
MFKEFIRGFANFFTKDKVIILVVFLVLVLGLSMYSGSKRNRYDAMTGGDNFEPASYVDLNADNEKSNTHFSSRL